MAIKRMHIGLDDTDSTRGGCTTYLATLIIEELKKFNVKLIDFPNLIRLNPNVPWKTRGNGAVCIRIKYNEDNENKIKETVITTIEEKADLDFKGTDPGIVFFNQVVIPNQMRLFAKMAINSIVNIKEALEIIKRYNAEAIGFKEGRGIIGSLAAIGETLCEDYTYELITYRNPDNYGLKLRIDEKSIFEMDRQTTPYTFNNIDSDKNRILITPRGPDPILYGIRGETPEILDKASMIVNAQEPIERKIIFRTNQGTDIHLKRTFKINQLTPYHSGIVKGIVLKEAIIIPRRHLIFTIRDETSEVSCAAYEKTGKLRYIVRNLIPGDYIAVYGSVREPSKNLPLTINLEKIEMLKLAHKTLYHNPTCQECGKRLKSMGKNQGFRCEKCKIKYHNLKKIEINMKREIKKGLYIASPRSQRHLTKPFRRYGIEKDNIFNSTSKL